MKSESITPEAVTAALRSLGNTPDEVANALRKQGVRGFRENSFACPVANFLLHKFGQTFRVGYSTWGGGVCAGTLPSAVAGFVFGFDQGIFDYLHQGEEKNEPVGFDQGIFDYLHQGEEKNEPV